MASLDGTRGGGGGGAAPRGVAVGTDEEKEAAGEGGGIVGLKRSAATPRTDHILCSTWM